MGAFHSRSMCSVSAPLERLWPATKIASPRIPLEAWMVVTCVWAHQVSAFGATDLPIGKMEFFEKNIPLKKLSVLKVREVGRSLLCRWRYLEAYKHRDLGKLGSLKDSSSASPRAGSLAGLLINSHTQSLAVFILYSILRFRSSLDSSEPLAQRDCTLAPNASLRGKRS